jgi:riboflavin kinase/FMN adenylyltransferase
VFAVRVHGLPGGTREGVASLGVRPTVRAGGHPLLEVFILDFDQPIYGQRIRVEFLHKLRDEARYPDLDTLRRKIGEDVEQARDWFRAAAPA